MTTLSPSEELLDAGDTYSWLKMTRKLDAAFEDAFADTAVDLTPAGELAQRHNIMYEDGETQQLHEGFCTGYEKGWQARAAVAKEREQALQSAVETLTDERDRWAGDAQALQSRLEAVEKALRIFGVHGADCATMTEYEFGGSNAKCTCPLGAALSGEEV